MRSPHNIAVLFGGQSVEHDSSIAMYFHFTEIFSAELEEKARIKLAVYQDRKGYFRVLHDPFCQPTVFSAIITDTEICSFSDIIAEIRRHELFLVSLLQGTQGEDGVAQGAIEMLDVPSNLGPVFPAALSMNKWAQAIISKQIAGGQLAEIPSVLLSTSAKDDELCAIVERFEGTDCVLKPNDLGASAFCKPISRLKSIDLQLYSSDIESFTNQYLVQERIFGNELSCGVFARDNNSISLPVISIKTTNGFLGLEEKFSSGGYNVEFLSEDDLIGQKIRLISKSIFDIVGYDTICRFDFIVREDSIYFLEANSKPGLTSDSHYILMLKQAGLSYFDLVSAWITNWRNKSRRESNLPYKIERIFG